VDTWSKLMLLIALKKKDFKVHKASNGRNCPYNLLIMYCSCATPVHLRLKLHDMHIISGFMFLVLCVKVEAIQNDNAVFYKDKVSYSKGFGALYNLLTHVVQLLIGQIEL